MSYRHISSLFIANRGEIALRIIRTAHKLGMRTILPVIKDENSTLPAQEADEVLVLDDHSPTGNYLNHELMIRLAIETGVDAIHPGYGFLSENAAFARQVEEAGLIWVGPSPDAIEKMGDKLKARKIAKNAGVSISRAIEGTPEEIIQHIDQLAFPLLIKAAAGGGGKAMQIANQASEVKKILDQASGEALRYFGNSTVFVEEYIQESRHIEIQVLGDHHGNLIHLFERECSIQRRYQKIIEESPSPFVNAGLREKLTRDALRLCRKIGYFNAGTVEFIVDTKGQHYFLEMNTRLQVEHPVTEVITGIDLVEQQLKTAMGLPLDLSQDRLNINGHAIETRIYAEDALKAFSPSPGTIHFVSWPESNRGRTDTYFSEKTEILPDFDPMLAKIIAHGQTREATREKLWAALQETSIVGITTNLPYLRHLIKTQSFIKGETNTHFARKHNEILQQAIHPNGPEKSRLLMAAYAVWIKHYRTPGNNVWTQLGHQRWDGQYLVFFGDDENQIHIRALHTNKMQWSLNGNKMPEINNIRFSNHTLSFSFNDIKQPQTLNWVSLPDRTLMLETDGHTYVLKPAYHLNTEIHTQKDNQNSTGLITAPLPGRIIHLHVKPGDTIEKGAPVLTLEAMKMETTILAPIPGVLKECELSEGEPVKAGQLLARIEKQDSEKHPHNKTEIHYTNQ